MSAFYVFVVFCFLARVSADSGSKGIDGHKGCPKVTTVPNFNPLKLLDEWYFIYATMNYTGEKCGIWSEIHYEDRSIETKIRSKDGLRVGYLMNLNSPRLDSYYFVPKNHKDKFAFEFSVLGTDDNYMVIHWCHTVGDRSIIDASILTQERGMEDHLDEAFKVAEQNGLKREDFHYITPQSCPPK